MPSSSAGAETSATRAFCLSMHDVSPHTWPQCQILLDAVRAVADIPVTLLVVPEFHRLPATDETQYTRILETRLAAGDELALHGFTHLDENPPSNQWKQRFVRSIYTQTEGEFSALTPEQACRRVEMGLAWFAKPRLVRRRFRCAGLAAERWVVESAEAIFIFLHNDDASVLSA